VDQCLDQVQEVEKPEGASGLLQTQQLRKLDLHLYEDPIRFVHETVYALISIS
jgi:hypothetical protein